MFHRLFTILFPTPCLVCGYLEEMLCIDCHNKVIFLPHIRRVNELIIYSSHLYQSPGVIEQLINPFKYSHQSRVFLYFAPKMAEVLRLFNNNEDLILVPVPLHKNKLKERGYNQSMLLAKWIAKHLGLELKQYLRRSKETTPQAQLAHREARKENMRGAFEISTPPPRDRHLVLVDDIVTTGSTLLECQKCLLEAGAKSVIALTLADRNNETPHPWN